MTYRARTVFAGALVWSAVLIAAVISPAWFGRQVIRDEDRFVETIEQTVAAPEVQDKLATLVADEVLTVSGFGPLDVDGDAEEDAEATEEEATTDETTLDLGLVFSDDIQADAEAAAKEVIESRRGQEIFAAAVRETHREVIQVLAGEEDFRSIGDEGQMTIDLGPIVLQVLDNLQSEPGTAFLAGIEVPDDVGQFVVSEDRGALALGISYLRVIDDTVVLLIALVLVGFAGAIAVSAQRGTTMMEIGGGLLFLSAFFIGLIYAGRSFLSWLFIREGLTRESFRIVFKDLTQPFVEQEITLAIIGAVLLGGGYLIHRFLDPDEFDEYIDYGTYDSGYVGDQYGSWKAERDQVYSR